VAATVRPTRRPAAAAAAAGSDAVPSSSQSPSTSTWPDDGRTGNGRHATRRDDCVVDVMLIVCLNINAAEELFLQNYEACAGLVRLQIVKVTNITRHLCVDKALVKP